MKAMSVRCMSLLVFFAFIPFAGADDKSEVLDVIQAWADLESNLVAQADLIRDDRIQIAGGIRQTNQKLNLEVQVMNHEAGVKAAGGEPTLKVRIEDPIIRVYGDVAVASFIRLFNFAPYGKSPNPPNKAWCTMVLVKEMGIWRIAHHHLSPA
jgi:ketosteroid isomerase-like protein